MLNNKVVKLYNPGALYRVNKKVEICLGVLLRVGIKNGGIVV